MQLFCNFSVLAPTDKPFLGPWRGLPLFPKVFFVFHSISLYFDTGVQKSMWFVGLDHVRIIKPSFSKQYSCTQQFIIFVVDDVIVVLV